MGKKVFLFQGVRTDVACSCETLTPPLLWQRNSWATRSIAPRLSSSLRIKTSLLLAFYYDRVFAHELRVPHKCPELLERVVGLLRVDQRNGDNQHQRHDEDAGAGRARCNAPLANVGGGAIVHVASIVARKKSPTKLVHSCEAERPEQPVRQCEEQRPSAVCDRKPAGRAVRRAVCT
eukprot:scaffold90_cov264-Pinguiococcus_pyrenoidosus.AAC.7